MKELDFDELDRAVSSLMSDIPQESGATDTLKIVEKSEDTQTNDTLAPPQEVVASPVEGSEVRVLPQEVVPAKRRSGRFMDVVHPSSDMKISTMGARSLSREGVSITPPAKSAAASPLSESERVVAADISTATIVVPTSSSDDMTWPDPIDVSTQQELKTGIDSSVVEESELAPLTSPFLTGAKVEKRPLGGQATDETVTVALADNTVEQSKSLVVSIAEEELPKSESVIVASEPTADTPLADQPASEVKAPPLPEELGSALMAIESGQSPSQVDVVSEATLPTAKTGLAINSSIPQQYAEQPNTGDITHAPMYAAEDTNQALLHPVKKKSGWLWVLWILLVASAAMGIAAALYFFDII